jgi:hypothetical protein
MIPKNFPFRHAQERKIPSPKCETPARGASVWTETHGQNNKESWQQC